MNDVFRFKTVPLHISTRPRVLLTIDKVLLLGGDDADQMRIDVPAVLLCIQPRLSCKEVQVAVALEFGPAFFALLFVCQQPHPIQSMLSLHLDTSNYYSVSKQSTYSERLLTG